MKCNKCEEGTLVPIRIRDWTYVKLCASILVLGYIIYWGLLAINLFLLQTKFHSNTNLLVFLVIYKRILDTATIIGIIVSILGTIIGREVYKCNNPKCANFHTYQSKPNESNSVYPPPQKKVTKKEDIEKQLIQYKTLLDEGIITQEDYEKRKAKLLEDYSKSEPQIIQERK